MRAHVSLSYRGRTLEEHTSHTSHILLLLNSCGKILRQIPMGGGRYRFTVEPRSLEELTRALSEFERTNPWLRVDQVAVES